MFFFCFAIRRHTTSMRVSTISFAPSAHHAPGRHGSVLDFRSQTSLSAQPSAPLEEPTHKPRGLEKQLVKQSTSFYFAALTVSASTSWAFLLSPWRDWPNLVSSALSFGTVSAETSSNDSSAMMPCAGGKANQPRESFCFHLRTEITQRSTHEHRRSTGKGSR